MKKKSEEAFLVVFEYLDTGRRIVGEFVDQAGFVAYFNAMDYTQEHVIEMGCTRTRAEELRASSSSG